MKRARLHKRTVSREFSCQVSFRSSFPGPSVPRVAIFRQKNYSAEYGTSRNRRQFRRNSACFAEEKNLRSPFRTIYRKRKTIEIPFRAIPRKRKTLGVPFRNISWKRKNLGIPFRTISLKRKTLGIPFRTILGREKPLEFRSEPFSEEKNLGIPIRVIFGREKTWGKRLLMLAASLNFIISRNSVPFRSELRNGLLRNTRNHMEWAFNSAE